MKPTVFVPIVEAIVLVLSLGVVLVLGNAPESFQSIELYGVQGAYDDLFRGISWDATLHCHEANGSYDYCVFGEAPDALDGPPSDVYDVAKPPGPIPPYIRVWLDDNHATPFDYLLKDYRQHPDVSKTWNLSIQWVPSDAASSTLVTMSWNHTLLYASEYDAIGLYESSGTVLLSDMLVDTNYSVACDAWVINHFHIVCSVAGIQPPVISDEQPPQGATNVVRPPAQLQVMVQDSDSTAMNISLFWRQHDVYHSGDWVILQAHTGVGNGTYSFVPPSSTEWMWGNTTYTWSVNVTDGISWVNQTFSFTTAGSRYDVNNNNVVNFQDAGLVWVHRTSIAPYDGIYDVNQNGEVNFQDAGLAWVHRD